MNYQLTGSKESAPGKRWLYTGGREKEKKNVKPGEGNLLFLNCVGLDISKKSHMRDWMQNSDGKETNGINNPKDYVLRPRREAQSHSEGSVRARINPSTHMGLSLQKA